MRFAQAMTDRSVVYDQVQTMMVEINDGRRQAWIAGLDAIAVLPGIVVDSDRQPW
jgi:hypothetical protein